MREFAVETAFLWMRSRQGQQPPCKETPLRVPTLTSTVSARGYLLVGALFVGVGCTAKDSPSDAPPIPEAHGDSTESADTSHPDSGMLSPSDTGQSDPSDTDREDTGETEPPDTSPPYDQVCFRASHNSYSGEERGSIVAQLEAGVRQIEFDFHDNDYESEGFRMGHSSPGGEVFHEDGNPHSNRLEDWLVVVAEWSASNPAHAPIHMLLNIKDDMTDNRSTAEGSLAALNSLVLEVFGDRLFWSRDLGEAWPSVNSLRGKIIVGLTGRETTSSRVAYLRDRGANPAVAMNDHGQIIEVHKSETQDMLWFWTGQMQPDGRVIWWHHGRYGSGRDPAIALNNHGYFVEVHRSHSDDDLWTWTGRITETGDLEFLENTEFSEGREPSVSFTDLEGFAFREVHSGSGDAGARMAWDGVVSATDGGIAWGAHGATTDALFDVDRATSSAGSVAVESVTYGSSGANTLVYETDDHERDHIRYAQIAFIDSNDGDPDLVEDMTPFRSFRTGSHDGARSWRESGGISRVWRFSESDAAALSDAPPHFAATDEPLSAWYAEWAATNDCVD